MSRYILLCTIDASKLDLLGELRADHYGFLVAEQKRIVFGGPARVAEGGAPETMIIVIEAESLDDARAWIAREPYNRNGAFSHVLVRPWSQVLPETEPGFLRRTHEGARAQKKGKSQ